MGNESTDYNEDAKNKTWARWEGGQHDCRVVASGAGVVCYALHDGGCMVLLGREKLTPGWKQGSQKWSSFSGKLNVCETVEDGAAREFVEESLCLVPFRSEQFMPVRACSVVPCLYRGDFDATIDHVVPLREGNVKRHVSFVKRIPYSDYPDKFRSTREKLAAVDEACKRFQRIKKAATKAPRFFWPGFKLASGVVSLGGKAATDESVSIDIYSEHDDSITSYVFGCDCEAVKEAKTVWHEWSAVQQIIASLSDGIAGHPAVCLREFGGLLTGAFIERAYLEKSELRWWKIDELEKVMLPRSWEERDQFRKCFVDIIPALTKLLRSKMKDITPCLANV